MNPIWRKDGKAIFYLTADFGSVMETEVEAKGSDFTIGKTSQLFKISAESGSYQFYPFDVSAEEQKFIIGQQTEQSGKEITVIANWWAGLKK